MKIWSLRTHSLSCDPIIEPLRRLGHQVREVCYYQPGVPFRQDDLLPMIADQPPDLIVMLGQHDEGVGKVPPPSMLADLARLYPFIHICCDGSEYVWWEQLYLYRQLAPTMVHVNIDGVKAGFFEHGGWTTLCPMDHVPWEPFRRDWEKRSIAIGFCGGWGINHPRGDDVERLIGKGLLSATKRPYPTYDGFRGFMGQCRASYNHAATGTADHMHVKARVLETAFAGAVLIEPAGSPASAYFTPGQDYLDYATDEDVEDLRKQLQENGSFERMAQTFREKAIELYSAEKFWPKAFALAGVSN